MKLRPNVGKGSRHTCSRGFHERIYWGCEAVVCSLIRRQSMCFRCGLTLRGQPAGTAMPHMIGDPTGSSNPILKHYAL